MKNFTPLLIGLVIGALVGSFLTNAIVSSASASLARKSFYAGMALFCRIATPPTDSNAARIYNDQDCSDMLIQAEKFNYFEQVSATPTPAP